MPSINVVLRKHRLRRTGASHHYYSLEEPESAFSAYESSASSYLFNSQPNTPGAINNGPEGPLFRADADTNARVLQPPRLLRGQHRHPAHIGTQHFRNRHAAVCLLVVLQHRHQRAAHGQARSHSGLIRDDG